MTRAAAVVVLCCIASPAVFAQSSDPDQLSDKERLGWRLYEQSCSICHTKPNLVLGQFGPVLSRESLNGRTELVREVIANGTPRMPGFKHHFAPAEIDDHLNRGRNMDTRTPLEQCAFVV
jgi:mono/diheme cytochrome c family protein